MSKIKMLVLSLTGQCNYACKYCYAAYHDAHYLTSENAIKALEIAVTHNTKANAMEPFILQFSGGEPLLNWETLQAVVEYVETKHIPAQLQVQTNGSLLTDAIAKYLYTHKVGIGVSLDGRPKVNDRQRLTKSGASAAMLTIKGIEVLKRNNIACGVTCVVTSENVDELDGIVELAYYLGNVRRLGFDLLRYQGRGSAMQPPAKEAMAKAIAKVFAKNELLAQSFGYKIHITQHEKCEQLKGNVEKNLGFAHCIAMNGEALFVDAQGKFYACASFVDDGDFYLGDVTQGILQEQAEKIAIKVKKAMSFCCECKELADCGGGCLARWYKQDNFEPYTSECVLKLQANEKL